MKRVFCFVKQTNDIINIYLYMLNLKNQNFIKKFIMEYFSKNFKQDYVIQNEIILNFPYSPNLSKESIKNYGRIINEKLKEKSYEESLTDVVFEFDGNFESSFSLPRLKGKALSASYESEIEKQFGSILNDYLVSSKRIINENKGYTYEMVAIKKSHYRNIIEILSSSKLKIDKCVYLPTIFTNINSNKKNAGIFLDDNKTYLFITENGILTNYRTIEIGYNTINESICEKFGVDMHDVNRFRTENMSKIALKRLIYQSMRKIIEQLYVLILADSEKNTESNNYNNIIDKTYIYSLDGRTNELILGFIPELRKKFGVYKLDTKYRYQVYIDAYYNNQKNFIFFTSKVKYEKK